jgi:hypothetical protein
VRFDWNEEKAAANLVKHGISFNEATTVVGDSLSSTYPDRAHSASERRWITVGASETGRILVVAHTEMSEQTIRIISARRATRREREFHEEG